MRFVRWDQSVNTEMTNELLKELADWHLSQIANAMAEREHLRDCITRGDFLSVCDLGLHYEGMAPLDAYHLRQVQALYNKRADLEVGIDKEAVAFRKFEDSERLCLETNRLFGLWSSGKFQFPRDVEQVFHHAQRKIATVLGDVPSLSELHIRFGPGSTTQVQKRMASAREKLSQTLACSEDLLPVLDRVLEEVPSWVEYHDERRRNANRAALELLYGDEYSLGKLEISPATSETATVPVEIHRGKLSFVPKTLKTDRSIAIEPSLNTMFQAGIGGLMAKRLKRVGVDIRDQTRNQRMAREGSITGELATLDLSSASDTVARELVYHLLPIDWALMLDTFRTGELEYKSRVFKLQKFSSMGNGFTFPLETLIFWALTSASVQLTGGEQSNISIYGDDIICPVGAVDLLSRVLHSAGFLLNKEKSFASGPFRESCGKDYISGIDIRPAYVKGCLTGADAFRLHNFYVRTWQPEPQAIVLRWIHESLRIFGPDGYGDGHLLGEWTPQRHKRDWGYGGYTFETFTWKPRRSYAVKPGDRLLPAYSIYAASQEEALPFWDDDDWLVNRESAPSFSWDRDGNLGVTLPGKEGCKRIKIYTLTPA